jgi:hypothetical protein
MVGFVGLLLLFLFPVDNYRGSLPILFLARTHTLLAVTEGTMEQDLVKNNYVNKKDMIRSIQGQR